MKNWTDTEDETHRLAQKMKQIDWHRRLNTWTDTEDDETSGLTEKMKRKQDVKSTWIKFLLHFILYKLHKECR